MSNESVQTLDDLVRYSQTSSYSIPKVSLLYKDATDVVIFDKFIYEPYRKYLLALSVTVELTDEEYYKYMYRPELMAETLYGNPNLGHLILWLNNVSEYKFTKRRLKLLPRSIIGSIYQDIVLNEQSNVEKSALQAIE
jgi:hypothetical protein